MESTIAVALVGFCTTLIGVIAAWRARPWVDRRNGLERKAGNPSICIFADKTWSERWEALSRVEREQAEKLGDIRDTLAWMRGKME